MTNFNIQEMIIMIIVFILSIVIHELAHAYTAFKLGDYTVKEKGRLTLNPLAHLDPMGTLALLLFGFGWAKPVQIDSGYFKDREQGIFLTALAGPASNLAMGLIYFILLFILYRAGVTNEFLILFTYIGFRINLMLMLLNLIPLPPLDGSKILIKFMDRESYANYSSKVLISTGLLIFLIVSDIFPNVIMYIEQIFLSLLF